MITFNVSKLYSSYLKFSYNASKIRRVAEVDSNSRNKYFKEVLRDLKESFDEITADHRTIVRDLNEVSSFLRKLKQSFERIGMLGEKLVDFYKKEGRLDGGYSDFKSNRESTIDKISKFLFSESLNSPLTTLKLISEGKKFSDLAESMNKDIANFVKVYEAGGFKILEPEDPALKEFLNDILKGVNSNLYKVNNRNIMKLKTFIVNTVRPLVANLYNDLEEINIEEDPSSPIYSALKEKKALDSPGYKTSYQRVMTDVKDLLNKLNTVQVSVPEKERVDLDELKYLNKV